jgi:hypothetical protein
LGQCMGECVIHHVVVDCTKSSTAGHEFRLPNVAIL